jgi:prepilin-type N-terminal cleavage/methylation domain-containing protein
MNSFPSRRWRREDAAFTLVEIMIVVVIIGLLAAMAIPAFARVREAAQNTRYISDLRTFAQAFETYAAKNGTWPANAGSGVVPAGMSGELKDSVWIAKNSLGGRWNWDRNNYGGAAVISVANITVSDEQLTAIDVKIDDGDLNTGRLQKISGRFCYILE